METRGSYTKDELALTGRIGRSRIFEKSVQYHEFLKQPRNEICNPDLISLTKTPRFPPETGLLGYTLLQHEPFDL